MNVSNLDDTLSHKVGMIGMTVLMLGNSDPHLFAQRHYKLLGPLPVPLEFDTSDVLETVAIIFNVEADLPTNDGRATDFGRETIVWYIFNTANREKIYSLTKLIEDFSKEKLKQIKKESQTEDKPFFEQMLKDLQQKTLEVDSESLESTVTEIQKPISIKYSNFSFYKYDDQQDNLIPINSIYEIDQLPLFVLVDIKAKQINIIKLRHDVSDRTLFFVSKSVSNLNAKLKREYIVRNVIDEYEIMMHMEKIKKLQ